MEFYRRYSDVLGHPQLMKAGFWASAVFTTLCDVTAARDFGGHLPDAYLEPAWLARSMMLEPGEVPGGDPLVTIGHALSRLFVTGLLVRDEHGARVDGWERRQPTAPKTAAERKRKQRESLEMSRRSRNVTPVTNVTLGEERRREEKRGETTLSGKPPDPTPAELVLTATPKPEPKPRKPSAQEAFYDWAMTERARVFPLELPDGSFPPKLINSALKEPLRQAGEPGLKRGWLAYLATDYAKQVAPRGAFRPFLSQWSRHVGESARPKPASARTPYVAAEDQFAGHAEIEREEREAREAEEKLP